jgi:sugar lactone lactonase YvrE
MSDMVTITTLHLPGASRRRIDWGRLTRLAAVALFFLALGQAALRPAAAQAQTAVSEKISSPQSHPAQYALGPATPTVAATYGGLPLSFEVNQGQADQSVKFLARGQGYGFYLTSNEAVLALSRPMSRADREKMQQIAHWRMLWPFLSGAQRRKLAKMSASLLGTDTLRMELKGANSRAQVSGSDELPGTANYFLGNDPARWRTRVPTFAKVHYTGVYPGIDLIYYGNQRRLEYDFVIAPNANPRQVALHFSGAQQLTLDDLGNLHISGNNGEVAFEKPVIYQDEKGQRVPVKGQYVLFANHTVGFKVGKYDRSKALVIDPTLSYSTYLGGSTEDAGTAIAVDAAGSIYVVGFTADADFPVTTGAFQTTNTADNLVGFVAKLNAAGSALVYATYLGGSASTSHSEGTDAYGIAVDGAGSAYICGETFSSDFPVTQGAFQTQNKAYANDAQNAFISKLSPDGTALSYSTYLGGSGLAITTDVFEGDSPLRMTVDAAGSAYVVGTAYSTDFPTTSGAYQLSNKAAANLASNAFVTKLSPNGSSLVYSTYLGGNGVSPSSLPEDEDEGAGERGYGIAVDANDEAYVTGFTFSANFPATTSGYQQVNHGTANVAANAFVSKFNAGGTGLVGSTYLGGTGRKTGGTGDLDVLDNGDDGIGVALDASGDAYVVGVTTSTDFPTSQGAYQTANKAAANLGTNIFVSKLNPTLSTLMYSTYIGGSGIASTAGDSGVGDFGTGIAIDTTGNAYVTGATESRDFPVTSDAFQSGPRSAQIVDSGFFTEVNSNGSALKYSTYLGGSGAGAYGGTEYSYFEGDFFYDIALDGSANAYLTGYAYSYDFPVTKNGLQTVNNAGGGPGGNSFIAKFGATAGVTFLPTTTTLSSTTAEANITFTSVVKPATGTGVPTGTVNFYVNSVKATTVTLDPTGTATYTTNQLKDNLYDVIAAYSGDATYGASGSSLGLTPSTGLPATTLTLTANPASSVVGQSVTLTATLDPFNGDGFTTDGETVTFLDGGLAIGTGTLSGGVATFSTSALPPGVDFLTSSYPGDTNLAASVSQPLSYTVSQRAPTITSLNPNAVYAGSGDTVVTITGTNFLNGAVVSVNGTNQAATFVSATELTTTLTAAQLSTAGTLTLTVVNPDGGASNAAVVTVAAPPLQVTPATSLSFGSQTVGTQSPAQVVTLANTSTTAYEITGIILDLGVNPSDFLQTNNCPATLAGGANCQISITFAPAGIGAKSAGLLISDNSPVPSLGVNLSGTGTGGVLQVNPGNLKTIAGNGTAGYGGDGGPATTAELNTPDGIAFDTHGDLYIADIGNNVIRKVDTLGNITTVAGNGTQGFSGDGGPATAAELNAPFGVDLDAAGNLYIMDTLNARIRKVDTTGTITTVAGNGKFGFAGDGGPATSATLSEVQGARFDTAGNLYVPQCGPAAVRKIDTSGTITTVAGNGTDGFSGDGGPATAAQLNCPSGVVVDNTGKLFIADYNNDRIREVNASGVITTIAGNGTPGFRGDGGPALAAEVNFPNDVDLDSAGNLYIADSGNNRLRKIDTTGIITTVVGGLDNAGSAGINAPSALAFDLKDNLYFSDTGNNAIREVFPAGALVFPTTNVGTAATPLTVTLSNIGNVAVEIASGESFALSGNATDFSLIGGTCLTSPATLAPNGGSCTLQIGFKPTAAGTRNLTVSVTDNAVFSPQSFQISGMGETTSLPAVVLTTISPVGATVGASNTTITATGANFTSTSVVNFNSIPLTTTFVSATQLTAVVPAALLASTGTAAVTVTDSASDSSSGPAVFTIVPSGLNVTFSGPSTTSPGEQPPLTFQLNQPYPVDLAGTMTLTFAPDPGNPANPQVQFASGGTTLNFTLPANTTTTPAVMVQVGTISGTITVTLRLTAAGVNITPANVVPITIVVPKAAPTISAVSISTSGNTLIVLTTGYSTTREIQSATFSFTAANGATLAQKTVIVPAATLFSAWYTTAGSAQYGSAFTYSQQFTLSGSPSSIASVSVTLTNAVGTSSGVSSQ